MFLLPISPAPVLGETTSLVVPSGLQGQGRGGRASVSRSFTSFPGWAAPGLLGLQPVLSYLFESVSLYPALTAWYFDDLFMYLL